MAGFETFVNSSMKEFFADRAANVKNFAGDAAGAVGDGFGAIGNAAGATKDAIGSIDLNPFNNGSNAPVGGQEQVDGVTGVRSPIVGQEQVDGITSVPVSPTEAVAAPAVPEASFTPVDIKPGDTVTDILRNSGVNRSFYSSHFFKFIK